MPLCVQAVTASCRVNNRHTDCVGLNMIHDEYMPHSAVLLATVIWVASLPVC